jgi:hypothetical protein
MNHGVPGNDVDDGNPIYFMRGNTYQAGVWRTLLSATHDEDYNLVCLPANRIDKFARLFPHAKRVENAAQELYDSWRGSLTDAQKLALACADAGDRDELRKLDPAKVDDPALKRAIATAKINLDKLQAARAKFRHVMYHIDEKLPEWKNPLDGYPLVNSLPYSASALQWEHAYLYINAVFAADRKETVNV